jgi:hypothetical protein
MKGKKAVAFLKKSSAKNFCPFLHGLFQNPRWGQKFLPPGGPGLFFKKRSACLKELPYEQ